jgi:hypothetical protein
MCAFGWLLAGFGTLSCSEPFTSKPASGGAAGNDSGFPGGSGSAGGSDAGTSAMGDAGASAMGDAGASAMADAGASAMGGAGASAMGGAGASGMGGAGASAMGGAGASAGGNAGAGNSPAGLACTALNGKGFGGHCYIDVTVESVTAPQAVLACAQLRVQHYATGHLLVLDSAEEQSFVLKQFLVPFTDISDAWLGLTCDERTHPTIGDCFCADCSKDLLAEKQAAWTALGGASPTFGWINGNPNNAYRCAALGYNADLTIWGWVDRPCDRVSYAPTAGSKTHGYRTLCELEPG